MIGFVVVSDKKIKPTLNIRACIGRRDNLNVALIALHFLPCLNVTIFYLKTCFGV